MSITNVRNFIEKSGCGLVTAVVIGVVMLASVFTMNCARGQSNANPNEEAASEVIAKIGDSTLSYQVLQEQLSTQMGNVPPTTPLDQRAGFYAMLVRQATDQLIVQHLGKTKGVSVTEDDVKADILRQVDQQIEMLKNSMVQQKQLKSGATQEEFEKLFEKQAGQTLASVRDKALTDTLSNPSRSAQIRANLFQKKLSEKVAASAKVTDEDVKAFMRSYTVERISVSKEKGGVSPEDLIQKAAAELKAGKSFDEVQATYSEEKEKGPLPMGGAETFYDATMAPVRSLKAGQVSEPIKGPFGWTIVKMVKIDDSGLKNFEKEKETQRTVVGNYIAQSEMKQLQDAERGNVKILSAGLEHLLKVDDLVNGKNSATATKEGLLELAGPVSADPTPIGQEAATFGRFLAFNAAEKLFTEAEKVEQRPLKIEILKECERVADGVALRVELAELLTLAKDPAAVEELINAISQNTGSFGPEGQQQFSNFGPMLERMKKAGIVTPEKEREVIAAMDGYRMAAKEDAAFKAKQEEERKLAEAEQKKAEEAAKKEAEAAKKSGKGDAAKPAEPSTSELLNPGASKPPVPSGP